MTRILKPAAIVAILLPLIAVPLCAQEESPRSKSGETTEPSIPKVTVIEPGSEPRTELRYKFQPDADYKMIMEMSMSMAMELAGQKQPKTQIPTTRSIMTMHNKEVSSDGNLTYEFELTDTEILPGEGVNPLVVNLMKQQLDATKGMEGSATVTPRGLTLSADFKLPPNVTPQLRSMMDNMRQSIQQMSAPLPEEAVGVGAVWKIEMPIQMPQMKLTQVATYKLTKLEGDLAHFDVKITQTAPPQKMNPPGAPANIQVQLESMESSGSGKMQLNLTEVVPTSEMKIETKNTVSAAGQRVKTDLEMEMKIHQ
ncbi:MAG: hypothetical protein KDA80_18525 [Planctomycetaceae bacterium]|nr:hypothetical protein [Planctomycetaceae bacterium]